MERDAATGDAGSGEQDPGGDAGSPVDAGTCDSPWLPTIEVRVETASGPEPCGYGEVSGFFDMVEVLSDPPGLALRIGECPPDADCGPDTRVCAYELYGADPTRASEIGVNAGRRVQGYADPSFIGLDLVDNRRCAQCGPKPFFYARTGVPGTAPWQSVNLHFGEGEPLCEGESCTYTFALQAQRQTGLISVAPGDVVRVGEHPWDPQVELFQSHGNRCADEPSEATWWAWVSSTLP